MIIMIYNRSLFPIKCVFTNIIRKCVSNKGNMARNDIIIIDPLAWSSWVVPLPKRGCPIIINGHVC